MTPSYRLFAFIIGGFILASFANLFWEVRVVRTLQYEDRMVALRGEGDLLSLTLSVTEPGSKELFLSPVALRDVAEGGVLIVPGPNIVDDYTITNLARMTLTTESYRSELSSDEARALLGFTQLEGTMRQGGVWAPGRPRPTAEGSIAVQFFIIATSEESLPRTMRVLTHDGATLFVDDAIWKQLDT